MRLYTIIVTLLLFSKLLHAQGEQDISIHFGTGLSGLNYKIDADGSSRRGGIGMHFGAGYRYAFSENVGIVLGLEFSRYSSTARINSLSTYINEALDLEDNEFFRFNSTIDRYRETQQASFLQIPILAEYVLGEKDPFYVRAGVKIGIPLNANFKSTTDKIRNTAYFPSCDNTFDAPRSMGFGDFTNQKTERASIAFHPAVFASVEIGYKFLGLGSENTKLHVGLFLDYGLTNILASQENNPFVGYTQERIGDDFSGTFTVNSILESNFAHPDGLRPFTTSIRPIAFGIRLRLTVGRWHQTSASDPFRHLRSNM